MHWLRAFIELTELPTKAASFYPFMVGSLFAGFFLKVFHWPLALVYALAVLAMDLGVTALNNLLEAPVTFGRMELAGRTYSYRSASFITLALFFLGALAGSLLAFWTGPVVWFLGGLAFVIGLLYSAGPLPIARTPLGEVASALVMGGILPFVAAYLHEPAAFLRVYTFGHSLTLTAHMDKLLPLGLLCLPLLMAIANLMLTNNLRDRLKDFNSGRFTLPVFIGEKASIGLAQLLSLLGGLGPSAAVILGFFPGYFGLSLLLALFSLYLFGRFHKIQSGDRRFRLALVNLHATGLFLIFLLALALGLRS